MSGVRIRGGAGLGDSIYLRPIVDYLVREGKRVTVLSNYPELFEDSGADVQPFTRTRAEVIAHYVTRKSRTDTNQWQDVCICAGVPQDLALTFKWRVRNEALVSDLRMKAAGDPLVLVHGGRVPMGRTDSFGRELLPTAGGFQAALNSFADCFTVRIGKGEQLYPLSTDMDLNGDTSISDLLDIASACDGMVAQCSFAVPLAEVFDRPLLAVWATHGLQAAHPYIKQITPQKILSKPTSAFVLDQWPKSQIREECNAFRLVL